jgi:hypothetical protein
VLVEEETVLAVSRFLVKRGTIPHESATLMWRRRWCCLLTLWLWFGALGTFPLDLARLGGIGACLSTSGFCRFTSLLLQQQKISWVQIWQNIGEILLNSKSYRWSSHSSRCILKR